MEFSKIGQLNNAPVRNEVISGLNAAEATSVNNYTGNSQNPGIILADNAANRILPNKNKLIEASKNVDYSHMYSELTHFVDDATRKKLETLHSDKKLLSNKSNDGSTTIENLYKIMTEPRAQGFDAKIILKETIDTLADPYIITQDFGKIPEKVLPALIIDENNRVNQVLEAEKKNPKPEYERKELLQTITPVETLKEKTDSLIKKLDISVSPDSSIEERVNVISQKLSAMQIQAENNPQKAAEFAKDAADLLSLNQAAQVINFSHGHTCPACSMEFNLADRKPAEFARYAERLSSPDKCVKTKIKYSNIADDLPAAISKLADWKIDYKRLNIDNIEVTLRPDQNAFERAIIQEYGRAKNSRSTIDALLQSTFMQTGSEKTYNSLTDTRSVETGDGKGLNQEEGAFVESIVDYEGGKDSVTYMDLNDNLTKINKYNFDNKTTENMLTDTLKSGRSIMVGFLTDIDDKGNMITPGGHEILLTDIVQDKNGEKSFKYQDSDDGDHYEPSYMKVSELIRTLHHANLPKDIVKKYIPPQKDMRLMLINDYWSLKNQNNPNNLNNQNKEVPAVSATA